MAVKKVEGTFCLDGLIEGPVFSSEDEIIIGDFVKDASKNGVRLHLSIDGGRFNILPGTEPVKLQAEGISADSIITDCVDRWLSNYSAAECNRLMSTLRSIEFMKNCERRTVYGIGPDGKTTYEQQTVDAKTIAPSVPPTRKEILKAGVVILLTVSVLIGVSSFFVPYREIFNKFWQSVRPYHVESIAFENKVYSKLFEIEKVEADKNSNWINITCRTLEDFPKTEEQMDIMWKAAKGTLQDKLAIESIARGYVLCEFYNAENKFITHRNCRMLLDEKENDKFSLVIPYNRQINRVEIK